MKNVKILSMLMLLAILSGTCAKGETGSVQVENIPPNFTNLSIEEYDGLSLILLNVSDYNSYRDIHLIFFNLTRGKNIKSSFAYEAEFNSTSMGQLKNIIGNELELEASSINHSEKNEGLDSCYLDFEVYFEPVDASHLEITIIDMNNASASYKANYNYPSYSQSTNYKVTMGLFGFSLIVTMFFFVLLKRRGTEHEAI